jgi:hypothetical protein
MFKTVNYYESNDYQIFNLFKFNRDIDKAHVKKLVRSMKLHGFKGVIQVVRTKFIDGVLRYYIADGQHRLMAAKQLGLNVRFELTELKTKKETAEFIAELNTTSKSFGANNFLDVWSDLGYVEYIKLKQVQNETGFQITPLLQAYLFSSNQDTYRKGIMTFPNECQSDKIIEQMIDCNKYLPSKAFCRRAIAKVMTNPRYDHKKMINSIKIYQKLVGNFTENETSFKLELERLMNNCK